VPALGATPFFWPGVLPAAPLVALLAAAGVPPGVAPGAWTGLPACATIARPGLPGAHAGASTAGPGFPGVHASPTAHTCTSIAGLGLPGAHAGVADEGATTAHGAAAWEGAGLDVTGHGGWPELLATAAATLANSRDVTAAVPVVSNDASSQEVRLDARRMERFEVPANPFSISGLERPP
jgi:hypothetical protein